MKISTVALVLSSLIFTLSASAKIGLPSDLSKECTDYLRTLPPEIEYDFVNVPEDWDHPAGSPTLHIFYYSPKLHSMPKLAMSPIIYFNGGPGFPSHGIYEFFKNFPMAQGVPFLYVDQRGTGCSGDYPNVPITLEGAQILGRYGTRNIVRDAEAIRHRLFPDGRKWSAFGQSFGSAIVHRYIALAPEGLNRAFMHGLSLMTDGTDWVAFRLLAQKRVAAEYLKKYPEDEAVLARARALFSKDHCSGNQTSVTCGPGLLDQFAWASLSFPGSWKNLHANLQNLLTPSGSLNDEFLDKVFPRTIRPQVSIRSFMVAVIPGLELPGGLLNTWSCKPAVQRLKEQGEDPDSWFFNECRTALATRSTYDLFIGNVVQKDYLTLRQVGRSLREDPKLEAHLYSGEFDTFSARESYAEEIHRLAGRIHYTPLLRTGHDWMNEPAIWLDLKR